MKNITVYKVEEFLIALSIFVSSIIYFRQPFEGYFHYLIFILFLPFFIARYGAPIPVLKLLFFPLILGLYSVGQGEDTSFAFFKIFFGFLLSCTFYYYVFIHYDFNLLKLFRIYIKGCKIVSIIALVQAISFLVGLKIGYDYHWIFNKWGVTQGGIIGIRLNSIFPEPSNLAIMISPAVFLSLEHLISKKFTFFSRQFCFLFIGISILSGSSTGYFGILVSVIILLINYRRILDSILIGALAFLAFFFLYSNVAEFRGRVDAYSNIISSDELTMEDINTSSFVQYNNFHVTVESFKKHPIFGTGLGSYPLAYEKYSLTKAEDFLIKSGFDFNSQDANSLFLRTLAELGLLGAFFLMLIVVKFFVIKKDENTHNNIAWLISGSILILILLTYFRQGNYFLNGFPFFMWLYFHNGKSYNEFSSSLLNEK